MNITLEQRELFRLAGQRILDQCAEGKRFSAAVMRDARLWAAYPPLGRPLSPGELPEPLQGGALEAF
jgi:hypothetical protein